MKKILILLLTAVIVFSMGGCASKGQSGAGIGALTGALIGSHLGPDDDTHRLQNAVIGAGIGALFGYAVGTEMDKYDKYQVNDVLENNMTGKTRKWKNPDTGKSFEATPTHTYHNNGRPVRNIRIKADVDNDGHYDDTVYAKAKRNPDGRWELKQ